MNQQKPLILIIGAAGVLGQHIAKEISQSSLYNMVVGDYREERLSQLQEKFSAYDSVLIDGHDADQLEEKLLKFDYVIVAIKQESPLIQEICFNHHIPCLDVNAFESFAEQVSTLSEGSQTPSVVMSGLFPGLSGVLVHDIISEFDQVKEVDVFFVQSANGVFGKMGLVDMMEIISTPLSKEEGPFSEKHKLRMDGKEFTQHKIQHGEKKVLTNKLKIPDLSYWTGWDDAPYTQLIRFFIRTSLINPLLTLVTQLASKKDNQEDETVYLVVKAQGRINDIDYETSYQLTASSDYGMTAIMVRAVLEKMITSTESLKGFILPFEILSYADIEKYNSESLLTDFQLERRKEKVTVE